MKKKGKIKDKNEIIDQKSQENSQLSSSLVNIQKEKDKMNRINELLNPPPLRTIEEATKVIPPVEINKEQQIISFPTHLYALFNRPFYLTLNIPKLINDDLPIYSCPRIMLAGVLFSKEGSIVDLSQPPLSLRCLQFKKGTKPTFLFVIFSSFSCRHTLR